MGFNSLYPCCQCVTVSLDCYCVIAANYTFAVAVLRVGISLWSKLCDMRAKRSTKILQQGQGLTRQVLSGENMRGIQS